MQGFITTMAGSSLCLMERRITECKGHLYHTCNHESELRNYSGEDSWFIPPIWTPPSLKEEDSLKTLKNILLITEKNPITVCTAAVGSSVRYFLTSVALRPPSSLTQLPLLILGAFDILLQQGALQSSGFLLLLCSPQNADNHARSQAPRLYHISVSQDSSSHTHSFLSLLP